MLLLLLLLEAVSLWRSERRASSSCSSSISWSLLEESVSSDIPRWWSSSLSVMFEREQSIDQKRYKLWEPGGMEWNGKFRPSNDSDKIRPRLVTESFKSTTQSKQSKAAGGRKPSSTDTNSNTGTMSSHSENQHPPTIQTNHLNYTFPNNTPGLIDITLDLPAGSRTLLIGGKPLLTHSLPVYPLPPTIYHTIPSSMCLNQPTSQQAKKPTGPAKPHCSVYYRDRDSHPPAASAYAISTHSARTSRA